MKAPREVIEMLESILGIYFFDIGQRERAAFVLVDNLVELCCKARLRERKKGFDRNLNLEKILKLANVGGELKKQLLNRRKERNSMQHDLVAVTVSPEHCADYIMDLIKLINKLWGKYALEDAHDWIVCAIRVVKLYSKDGNRKKRMLLEEALQSYHWNKVKLIDDLDLQAAVEKLELERELTSVDGLPVGKIIPKDNQIIITIGSWHHWTYLFRLYYKDVSTCLDELDIDDI